MLFKVLGWMGGSQSCGFAQFARSFLPGGLALIIGLGVR
jgi:hypothetical protein